MKVQGYDTRMTFNLLNEIKSMCNLCSFLVLMGNFAYVFCKDLKLRSPAFELALRFIVFDKL